MLVSWTFCTVNLHAQEIKAFEMFNKSMKKTKYKKLVKDLAKADVVFIGEVHNDPIAHWIEMKVLKTMQSQASLVLGLEMFERDVQEMLDKYLEEEINEDVFKAECRPWTNYDTDYKPFIEYSKVNKIPVVATNIPRVYANLVYKEGFEVLEGLVDEEKSYIAPIPIDYDPNLKSYKAMLDMVEGHGGENFPKAQAIKDATMAYSISETFEMGKKYLHLNGSYHSDDFEGIVHFLNKYKPELKVLTITIVTKDQEGFSQSALIGKADYIFTVDEDMTKTY